MGHPRVTNKKDGAGPFFLLIRHLTLNTLNSNTFEAYIAEI